MSTTQSLTTEQRIAIATDFSAEKVKTINELVEDESLKFGEWLNSNAYNSYDSNGKNCGWNLHKGMDGNIYTTKQLYELSKTK